MQEVRNKISIRLHATFSVEKFEIAKKKVSNIKQVSSSKVHIRNENDLTFGGTN